MDMYDDHIGISAKSAAVLDSFTASLALVTLAESGFLEAMAQAPVDLPQAENLAERGALLAWMLRESGVAKHEGTGLRLSDSLADLTPQDRADLVERARFALMAAEDLIAGRRAFFTDPPQFFARARTFGFFCYGRARETRLSNLQDTESWVNYVSALNAAEAPVLARMLPLKAARRVLEIGGNAGGFALAMLAENPDLHAVVMDLPAVCEIGRNKVAGVPGAERLRFVAGDATRDPWPDVEGAPPDLICFKSVLHDWDEEKAALMVARAVETLAPGGRLAVLERGRVEDATGAGDFALAANLVFAGFYRRPDWYAQLFERLGLQEVTRESCQLDLPFHVISGQKPA